jgi:hypothetical protein
MLAFNNPVYDFSIGINPREAHDEGLLQMRLNRTHGEVVCHHSRIVTSLAPYLLS